MDESICLFPRDSGPVTDGPARSEWHGYRCYESVLGNLVRVSSNRRQYRIIKDSHAGCAGQYSIVVSQHNNAVVGVTALIDCGCISLQSQCNGQGAAVELSKKSLRC